MKGKEKERDISCFNSLPEEEQVTHTQVSRKKGKETLNSSLSCVKKGDDEEGKIREKIEHRTFSPEK